MKPELMLLVWATLLTLVQAVVAVQGAMMQVGLPTLAGNREGMPEIKGWAGRAARAHRNMLENLVLFAALVLVAALAGKTNATTLLGAQIFLYARIAYALVYIAGIPWLRTGVWAVSVVGLAMIFVQLI
ncbi:MAG TPA: MAPEG family protein [Burkholderiales bacterium]|nr:MAPEG family protein [Burkholderiales bacterium]